MLAQLRFNMSAQIRAPQGAPTQPLPAGPDSSSAPAGSAQPDQPTPDAHAQLSARQLAQLGTVRRMVALTGSDHVSHGCDATCCLM